MISLGGACGVAGYAREFGIRKAAYPFDWLLTLDFNQVCKLIEERFEFFLVANVLQWNGRGIKNVRYDLEFLHDFPTRENNEVAADDGATGNVLHNFIDYLDGVKKKYAPRIARFFEALNGSNPVVFMRTHIDPIQAQRFIDLMAIYYPNLNYTLVIIHRQMDEKYEWSFIPEVLNFYVDSEHGQQFLTQEWGNIFRTLGLISTRSISARLCNQVQTQLHTLHSNCCV